MTSSTRIRILCLLLAIASAVFVMQTFGSSSEANPTLDFSEVNELVMFGNVDEVQFTSGSSSVTVVLADGEAFDARVPPAFMTQFIESLVAEEESIALSTRPAPTSRLSSFGNLLLRVAPLLLMLVLVWFIWTRMGSKSNKGGFDANSRRQDAGDEVTTFADVAGADEALVELSEIRDFLEKPDRFWEIGAKIPKGVLLYGPPGTGKTLLARAVAGEAGVPFYTLSGSDFVESFVGVGASRVRDLFKSARENAPAIIFVDEIDAVGRHRGGSGVNGNEEREQTLNQLLVEMDGFDGSSGVIFIAATNRPDVLDPALLRPGRFDRQVAVDVPDLEGRRAITAVHSKGKPLGPDVSIDTIARRTPGFTGADLANLLNEAALLSARRRLTTIGQAELDDALDRVIAGPKKSANTLSEKEKEIIAFHEAGHALVGHVLPGCDKIHKVSIIARGRALGWTLALPERDRVMKSESELRDEMAMLLGGRIAEELIFQDPTTGAANDIERVTQIARSMVTTYGMSSVLGRQKFGVVLGEAYASHQAPNYSDEIAKRIDEEIRDLIRAAGEEARELLTLHRSTLDRLADALIEHETLDEAGLAPIFDGITDERLVRATSGALDLR